MRRLPVIAAAVGLLTGAAGAASAAPDLPAVPKNCHEVNEFLHINNVRSCDGE